jgi:hypothetical protein
MMVKPALGEWEIPRISGIRSLERRRFAELEVPGLKGSLFHDLNTTPTRIEIVGSLYGDENRNGFLETVRGRFAAGEPVTFVADIVTSTSVEYVIIESLEFEESGHAPDQTDYRIVLRESPPPPPPPDPFGDIDAGLLDEAGNLVDSVTGALDAIDALGNIPDIGDPTPPVRESMDRVREATTGITQAGTLLAGLFE